MPPRLAISSKRIAPVEGGASFTAAALPVAANANGRGGHLGRARALFKDAVEFRPYDSDLLVDHAAVEPHRGAVPRGGAVPKFGVEVRAGEACGGILLGRALFLQDR